MARKTPTTPADPGDWTHNLADFETEGDYLAALEEWQAARAAAGPVIGESGPELLLIEGE